MFEKDAAMDDEVVMVIEDNPMTGGKTNGPVRVKALARPYGPYTHYFDDPDTGQPSLVSLHQIDDELVQLPSDLCKYIARCMKAGRYLIATFPIEDGRLFCEWVTRDFPKGDFEKAGELMVADLKKKTEDAPEAVPSPVDPATLPPQVRQVYEQIMNSQAGQQQPAEGQVVDAEPVAKQADPNEPKQVWPKHGGDGSEG